MHRDKAGPGTTARAACLAPRVLGVARRLPRRCMKSQRVRFPEIRTEQVLCQRASGTRAPLPAGACLGAAAGWIRTRQTWTDRCPEAQVIG